MSGSSEDFMTSYVVPDSASQPTGAREARTFDIVASSSASVPVAVIDEDQATRSRLAMQLGDQVIAYASVDELSNALNGNPMVVVLGPSCGEAPGLLGGEDLIHQHPEVGAILVANILTTELFQRALRTGVRDVLAAPVDTAQLNEAVRRVGEAVGATKRSSPTLGEDADGVLGRVITVFSTKGGAGKSMVAANLAVTLAQRSEKPVVLVDADLQFGDIAVMLKLSPQHTVVDAVGSMDRLDAGLLQNLLVKHPASGLRVLAAPLEPAFADQITADDVSKIVNLLRTFCGYVVIDTPAYFNDVVLNLIEESDDVLLVAGMDIPNIKNVKIGLQTMRLLNTPMQKIHLVLNRANSKVKLDVSEVERTLQVKAESQLPSDVVVPQSVNKGIPVVMDAPKSGIARSLEQLADLFCPVPTGKKKKR
jgi:pilus assembly protein CpaE